MSQSMVSPAVFEVLGVYGGERLQLREDCILLRDMLVVADELEEERRRIVLDAMIAELPDFLRRVAEVLE